MVQALEKHEVCLSDSVKQELEGTFQKLSKKLSKAQILFLQERIRQIVAMASCIPITVLVSLSRDKKDDHYLSLCKEAKADFLITGDKDFLSIPPKVFKTNGIYFQVLTPNSFLEVVL